MKNLYFCHEAHKELMANAARLFIDVDTLSEAGRGDSYRLDAYLKPMVIDYDRCSDYIARQEINRSTYQDFLTLSQQHGDRADQAALWSRQYRRKLQRASDRMHERLWYALTSVRPYLHGTYVPRRRDSKHDDLRQAWKVRKAMAQQLAAAHKLLTNPDASDEALTACLSSLLDIPEYSQFKFAVQRFLHKYDLDTWAANRLILGRFYNQEWVLPVWHEEPWYQNNRIRHIHAAHVSLTDCGLISYHQSVDKMRRDVQTPIKPGKYLQKFFGNVLSSDQIRLWAERQTLAARPATLEFIPTDDPDGWEWVYENAPYSCMRYNRHSRYLDESCYGDKHPARVYASGENDLALAYIMMPGKVMDRTYHSDSSSHVVAARTIVNMRDKTWLRIYSEDDRYRTKIRDLLDANGFRHDSSLLYDQRLARIVLDSQRLVCPYLDGDYGYVYDDGDALIVSSDGCGAQNSSGVIRIDSTCCYDCGRVIDEEAATYVNDEPICDRCLEQSYVYANTRWGMEYIHCDNAVRCESDNEYYHADHLSRFDIVEDTDGNYWHIDDVCLTRDGWIPEGDARYLDFYDGEFAYAHENEAYELPDGKWCHEDDKDDVLADHYADEDEDEQSLEAA